MKTTTKRVTGDWLPEDHPGYEAEVETVRWNGWAVPRFTEEVARQVVADQEKMVTEMLASGSDPYDVDTLEITSETPLVIRHSVFNGEEVEDITAGTDGQFAIGGWSWCWYETDHYEEA